MSPATVFEPCSRARAGQQLARRCRPARGRRIPSAGEARRSSSACGSTRTIEVHGHRRARIRRLPGPTAGSATCFGPRGTNGLQGLVPQAARVSSGRETASRRAPVRAQPVRPATSPHRLGSPHPTQPPEPRPRGSRPVVRRPSFRHGARPLMSRCPNRPADRLDQQHTTVPRDHRRPPPRRGHTGTTRHSSPETCLRPEQEQGPR